MRMPGSEESTVGFSWIQHSRAAFVVQGLGSGFGGFRGCDRSSGLGFEGLGLGVEGLRPVSFSSHIMH